jgi:hypothetical protein
MFKGAFAWRTRHREAARAWLPAPGAGVLPISSLFCSPLPRYSGKKGLNQLHFCAKIILCIGSSFFLIS